MPFLGSEIQGGESISEKVGEAVSILYAEALFEAIELVLDVKLICAQKLVGFQARQGDIALLFEFGGVMLKPSA